MSKWTKLQIEFVVLYNMCSYSIYGASIKFQCTQIVGYVSSLYTDRGFEFAENLKENCASLLFLASFFASFLLAMHFCLKDIPLIDGHRLPD